MTNVKPVEISLTCATDDAAQIKTDFEQAACEEIKRLVALIRTDSSLFARLGEPQIESLDDGVFMFSNNANTVAIRPGLVGELPSSTFRAWHRTSDLRQRC